MDQAGHATVRVVLTCAEAHAILLLMQNGSFPKKPATVSATDKIRAALVRSEFDPAVDVEIGCTADEARFIARCREG